MEFLLGIVASLYGLTFLVFLFSELLGIGLGQFDYMPRPLNYLRAFISALFWPLLVAYVGLSRNSRKEYPSLRYDGVALYESVNYWRKYREDFPEEIARIFRKHPLLGYLSISFHDDGSREATVALTHRSTVMDIRNLPSWSPVRKTLEAYLARAEMPVEEQWDEGAYDDVNPR